MTDPIAAETPSPPGGAGAPRGEAGGNAAFLLIALGRATRERVEEELEGLGLAMRHLSALGHLAREPGLSYSELGRRAGITPQSMQATLRHLEQRAAIERRSPSGRGRSAVLHVTAGGQELLARGRAVLEVADERLADALGADGRDRLAELLWRAVRADPGGDPDGRGPVVG